METIGRVTKTGKEGRVFELDNANWYSHFNEKAQCNVGDTVKVEYKDNPVNGKVFHNWSSVEVTSKTSGELTSTSGESVTITPEPNQMGKMNKLNNSTNARVSALTNATNLCIARKDTSNEQVLEVAKEFLKFVE